MCQIFTVPFIHSTEDSSNQIPIPAKFLFLIQNNYWHRFIFAVKMKTFSKKVMTCVIISVTVDFLKSHESQQDLLYHWENKCTEDRDDSMNELISYQCLWWGFTQPWHFLNQLHEGTSHSLLLKLLNRLSIYVCAHNLFYATYYTTYYLVHVYWNIF